jgi:hypothetical protein
MGIELGLERYGRVSSIRVCRALILHSRGWRALDWLLQSFIELPTNGLRSHDAKAKVWRIETRTCVATHSHGDRPLWSARWLSKIAGKSEMFALGGGNQAISFYREAAG